MWFIYKHTNIETHKVYIGITKQSLTSRWKNGNGYKDSVKFYNAIKKYGWENFTHSVIQTTHTLVTAQILEIMWISFYKKRCGVYNITKGGEGSNGVPMSELTKNKISIANKGKNAWNKGKTGYIMTAEQKEKISKSNKGHIPWNKGKKGYHIGYEMPECRKESLMLLHSKPVLQYTITGEFIQRWKSAKEVQRKLGIFNIGKCCNGKIHTSGGFIWKYDFIK